MRPLASVCREPAGAPAAPTAPPGRGAPPRRGRSPGSAPPAPDSVDVAEGAESFLGGSVAASLLARSGVGARLDGRSTQLGTQGLGRRRPRGPHVAHLAGIVDDVEQL